MKPELPPRIAALPRNKAGLPVPYVVEWEGEEKLLVRYSEVDRDYALFSTPKREGGEPLLGLMEISRQREVVRFGLCQVCRARLDPRDRFVAAIFETTTSEGPMIREPWACPTCLAFALRVCPGLLRLQRDAELKVIRMSKWITLVAHTSIDGLRKDGVLAAESERFAGALALGFAKIKPARSSYVLDAATFLRSFG